MIDAKSKKTKKKDIFLNSKITFDESISKIKVSNGNHKIGRDTLIINMESATDCTSKKLGLCRICNKCYAMKAERQYPAVLPYRRLQARIWQSLAAQEIANQLLNIPGVKAGRIKYLRFSEAGDFRGQEDINKLAKIADLVKNRLLIYGYTARKDLNFNNIGNNIIVNGSGFMVTNEFKAVPAYTPGSLRCPGNCRNCNLCKTNSHKKIEVLLH